LPKQIGRDAICYGIRPGQINHGLGKITASGLIALAMPTKGSVSFATADLMNRTGSRLHDQLVKAAVEASHDATDDGIATGVFVEGVPDNDASILLALG
jgi:hypothetical protein